MAINIHSQNLNLSSDSIIVHVVFLAVVSEDGVWGQLSASGQGRK